MFADDLNVFKKFPQHTSIHAVESDMSVTKAEVHRWGKRNRVTFDASKEHLVIIHPVSGRGDDFKFLGCLFDVFLKMDHAIDAVVSIARPKVNAMLRTRGLYASHATMIMQYKTHIWGITEYPNGAILHASNTALAKLDRLQHHYVNELHLTAEVAFLDHNFAPPSLRRQIGVLGFLHKRVLGNCHPEIASLLPFMDANGPWHNKQLYGHMDKCVTRWPLFLRSLFGMVQVYNRLPQVFIDIDNVSLFQRELTSVARAYCSNGNARWPSLYQSDAEVQRLVF